MFRWWSGGGGRGREISLMPWAFWLLIENSLSPGEDGDVGVSSR